MLDSEDNLLFSLSWANVHVLNKNKQNHRVGFPTEVVWENVLMSPSLRVPRISYMCVILLMSPPV